jgi:hypothetical protein
LIAVAASTEGARQHVYVLTPAGLAKSAQAGQLWAEAQAEFVSKFGGESAAEAARDAFHRMGQMG